VCHEPCAPCLEPCRAVYQCYPFYLNCLTPLTQSYVAGNAGEVRKCHQLIWSQAPSSRCSHHASYGQPMQLSITFSVSYSCPSIIVVCPSSSLLFKSLISYCPMDLCRWHLHSLYTQTPDQTFFYMKGPLGITHPQVSLDLVHLTRPTEP
jgi:hypothetical protein